VASCKVTSSKVASCKVASCKVASCTGIPVTKLGLRNEIRAFDGNNYIRSKTIKGYWLSKSKCSLNTDGHR
jgi:hypothetical protein